MRGKRVDESRPPPGSRRDLLLPLMAEGSGKVPEAADGTTPEVKAEAEEADETGGAEARTEIKEQVEAAWVPERIQHALDKSKTMDEFRSNRPFRFLHLFSGEKDMLAEALRKECERARLVLYAEGIDRKLDRGVDLTSHDTFNGIDQSIMDGDWDGLHSGFPCSSFSMVRWRHAQGGAPPVRSAFHIYGLPGNSPSMQKEADTGTLMAVRSTWAHRKQVETCRRRQVPACSTLENPPGNDTSGSAWMLPEIVVALADTGSSEVEFNTCAYQSKLKERWFKPSKWAGRLEGLHELAKVCRCPKWVKHVPVVGKRETEAAGAYPQELATEIAVRMVKSWRRVLNLEWWRHLASVRSLELSALERERLDNDSRKLREEQQRKPPVKQTPLSTPRASSAMEWHQEEEESLPQTSARPSKKDMREKENYFAIGGMRNPAAAMTRLQQVRTLGIVIRKEWGKFITLFPQARQVAADYGSSEAQLIPDVGEKWRLKLMNIMGATRPDKVTLKSAFEFTSPLTDYMWDAWQRKSRDPEQFLGMWIREGVPMGMEVAIPTCGIFPESEAKMTADDRMDMAEAMHLRNYTSVEEQKEDAGIEVERYEAKGFCKILPWEVIHQNFPTGTASRLALILKQKPDGSTKRRIVIDLRRSGGNARAEVPERIVLPRACDVLSSARYMKAHEAEIPGVTSGGAFEKDAEFMLLDLKDAFCHFGLHPKELCHAVSPGLDSGTGILWCAMLFGYTAAPLIMGRLSAAIARLVQSLVHPAEGQTQMYVDDLLLLLRGDKRHRETVLAMVIYTLVAFGVQLSLDKGERGIRCTWIGTTFELHADKLLLGTPPKLLAEVQEKLAEWSKAGMLSVKDMRSVAGKLSWMAGITPRIRWAVAAIYAVIAAVERDEATGAELARAAKRDSDRRPKQGLAHRKRLGTALPWLQAALQAPHQYLIREEELTEAETRWGLVTDACPRGLGGILIQRIGTEWTMVETYEAIVKEEAAAKLGVEWNKPSSQSTMEALAILRGLQKWGPRMRPGKIVIRSDSSVALAMARKLSSPTASLNYLAAEIALVLEEIRCPGLTLQHIPGTLNKEADWLSRVHDRGEMPATLNGVKQRRTVAWDERVMRCTPPGAPDSAWASGVPQQDGVYECL